MKKDDKHAGYYEAILQLRPAKQEIVDFVNELLQQKGVSVAKIIKLKTGIDMYLSNQKFARSVLGPQLKRKFKGDLVISRSLYGKGHMSSRLVYRATILFRLKEDEKIDEK